jgi:hypothetical protein
MTNEPPATDGTDSEATAPGASDGVTPAGASPLRLRVGVLGILLWWIPFWLLAPAITEAMSGLPVPPSVTAVTASIVIVQTVIGLLGFWIAGAQVKTIIKKAPSKRASLRLIWSIFIHGEVQDSEPTATPQP